MRCHFYGERTTMTVRNPKGSLLNCCRRCKAIEKGLVVSCVYKPTKEKEASNGNTTQ